MKKVLKFVKGKRDDKKDGGITPSQSGDLISPAQTPEDERFLGLDNAAGYIVDFCGKDKSLTKLHKAAWQGNLEKIKNALKKIDIDTVDRHNRTALHFAVVQGHPNIVWFLLGNNARHTICDDDGRTPLVKAVECGHKECMNLLIERGGNINHADFCGNTSLHIAVRQGAVEILTILMQKGADPQVTNNVGEYPLHIALKSQNKEIIQLLLRLGASVNVVDRENRTPLMLAAKTGNLLLAQLFFEYGAQLYVVDSNGWTAEDYALLSGHQNVASELKTLMKKDAKPVLETHNEEDEVDVPKSEVDTWNDSHLSDASESKAAALRSDDQRKFSVQSEGEKSEKDDDLADSPGSGVVPPPCQPPRSWEIIEAGMIDEATANGSEPKRLSITALGSLHSRRESFTENSMTANDGPKYTLSLNRRKEPKNRDNVKQRFSFNEEDSLKSCVSGDSSVDGSVNKEDLKMMMNFKKKEHVKGHKSDSSSDWDSNLSCLMESGSHSPRVCLDGLQESVVDGPVNQVDEMWMANPVAPWPPAETQRKGTKSDESSDWDSGESFQNDVTFPPPPTALELGVNMAKSLSYMKGISIDHAPNGEASKEPWRSSYDTQSHSLDCLDEMDASEIMELEKTVSSKKHARQASITNQKWRSVELPKQQRPTNRLIDVNRRINEQLECYDQALRELAESSYAKRQDALISTLSESKSSKVENYYSLPSSKIKCDRESLSNKPRDNSLDYGMSLPLQFTNKKRDFIDLNSGPQSLPFSVNEIMQSAENVGKEEEVENNEKLGFEDKSAKIKVKVPEKPTTLDFKTSDGYETENVESPMSDEQTGSDISDRRSKRHMLLAMRDVKHAVQVTNSFKSSLDDQILSPLTKVDGQFDLSPKTSTVADNKLILGSSSEDKLFFCTELQGPLGRQETVIERAEFRRKSSSSESGDEPTLWLQEKVEKCQHESRGTPLKEGSDLQLVEAVNDPAIRAFSPLGAVYEELKAERRANRRSAASPSDNEDSISTRDKNGGAEDDGSPDISFSSGPIEPLGKDSGSDPDSSHQDATPVHHYSLKRHHKWLKDRLHNENKERNQLEEVATQLAEKAERLQYELADAREATKSRDEIITLLQAQLSRMEVAYTKSLEDSVHCRLQLTTLEQEILHLKELCVHYEEERDTKLGDKSDKHSNDLTARIRQLENEREGLSRVVVRLEQENRTLEKVKSQEDTIDDKRWTERCGESDQNSTDRQLVEPSKDRLENENTLKYRNIELESQIIIQTEINKKLQCQLDTILADNVISERQEISQSILLLNKKNVEMEKQLQILMGELERKVTKEEVQKENKLSNDFQITLEINSLKEENKVLNKTIETMQEEICRLKQLPNAKVAKLRIRVDDREQELKDEEDGLKAVVSDSMKSCIDLPDIVGELRKEVMELHETLEESRKGNLELEQQMRSFNNSATVGAEARAARDDELAWSDLYGIKNVRQSRPKAKNQSQFLTEKVPDDFIQRKVSELEDMLEKAKDEIVRQKVDARFRNVVISQPIRDSPQVVDLKNRVIALECEVDEQKSTKSYLLRQNAALGGNFEDRKKLEYELFNLKSQLEREYVPKTTVELDKFRAEILDKEDCDVDDLILNGALLEQCSTLAKEQHRAAQIRRRLGRQSNSWESESGDVEKAASPLSRDRPNVLSTPILGDVKSNVQNISLDGDIKTKITKQLERSILRCGLESPEETEPLQVTLLKKKYLC